MVDNVRPYTNPIPDDREIIPGIWNDIMDDLSQIFELSNRGNKAVKTFVQDQTSDPVDVHMAENLNDTSIAVETIVNTSTITVDPGHGIIVGNSLAVIDLVNSETFFIGGVIGVAIDVITMDTPVNAVYPIGSLVRVNSRELNIFASLASPRVFAVRPIPGQRGDITRVIMGIQDSTAMDFSTFGGQAPLTNGCVLRVAKGDGSFTNLFNWKTNGEFIAHGFDHSFQTKTGGGLHSLIARSTWGGQSKRGVVIRIDGSLGEEIQLVIQDNLTALAEFRMIVQGHLTQGD